MKDIVEYLSDMRWDIPGPIRQGALDEIDRLRAELAATQKSERVLRQDWGACIADLQASLAAKDARIAAQAGELSDLHKKYDDCRETLLEVSNALKVSENSCEALGRDIWAHLKTT